MCEQTEINYLDGDVVWVKLGSCWWPGEVVGPEKLPPDVLPSFRKPPIAVVKFFQEDTYEYVKNINSIYKYNCSRKNEFINKGLYMYRTKHGPMEKFPEDVIRAETAVGGDIEILTRDEFQETKKESYAGLFGDNKKTPVSLKKGKGRCRPAESPMISTPSRKMKEKADYKVHILLQGSTPSKNSDVEESSTPNTCEGHNETLEGEKVAQDDRKQSTPEEPKTIDKPRSSMSTATVSSPGIYSCHACSFSTARLNVLILHNKTHSVTFTPYTPSPVKKKVVKPSPKSTPTSTKPHKAPKPRKEKPEKITKKSGQSLKRPIEQPKTPVDAVKKPKTDQEIKSSLLADWDDVDEESNDDSATMPMAGSPEVPVAAESPAVPIPAELPSAQVPTEATVPTVKKPEETTVDKSESSDSKYEFCEDEDWPIEADGGRKIPRVKNPSTRKEDTKSVSLDDEDVAKEVAELLNKTTVPELPSIPDQLKVEENFPEPSVVKSPDKQTTKSPEPSKTSENPATVPQPTKAIFKTKTFFRSRHSRSQDAIGKYVAEQLNAVERMDMSESEINGSDNVSSPEARESPPIEPVKVARLAPKIQLKKMKAEAAQLKEKEKNETELLKPNISIQMSSKEMLAVDKLLTVPMQPIENNELIKPCNLLHDVLYPTQEIKPINEDKQEETKSSLSKEILNKETIPHEKLENKNEEPMVVEELVFTEPDINKADPDNKSGCDAETLNPTNIDDKKHNLDDMPEKLEQPYMNETTASAVDALLSVSREADRVTKVISDDPPEDLFEDDNKDTATNNINGFDVNVNEDTKSTEHIYDHKQIPQEEINSIPSDIDESKVSDNVAMYDEPNELVVSENEADDIIPNETEPIQINNDEFQSETCVETVPSESDLQIAEALINLPSTAIQSKNSEPLDNIPATMSIENENIVETENVLIDNNSNETTEEVNTSEIDYPPEQTVVAGSDNLNVRFETEQEKSENLNAAQSLVQMSESIDHSLNIVEAATLNTIDTPKVESFSVKQNNGIDKVKTIEQKVASLSSDNNNEISNCKPTKYETTSSKLLKILEEPCAPKVIKAAPTKQIIIPGKEKILNFEVAKSGLKGKSQSPVIIRRAPGGKTFLNNVNDNTNNIPEKIILTQDGPQMQTFTIQKTPDVPADGKKITIIQQKVRKVQKPPAKLQKIKPQNSLVSQILDSKISKESTTNEDAMFDINSMPIVLSDDILTPESIEKMPIVMSDGNLITNTPNPPNPPKLVKTKQTILETEKTVLNQGLSKPEVKTLLLNPVHETKVTTTPNILSKSSKLRGAKPMLVIDKTTGKQKIIMTKSEPTIKELKPAPTLLQPVAQNTGKADKFIILPTGSSPRPGRTQKIVIDPQSGKAHMLVPKGPEPTMSINDNKPVSAKLIPSSSDAGGTGNTVMIITNAQGAQSRIVLTSEHEKILFPNKQQPSQQNTSQLKTITHRLTTNSANSQKTVVTTIPQAKPPTRIVTKQKNAIITSKGQLIVGGRVATTAQNIAPMPEIRPVPKRLVPAEPKKIVQAIQKQSSEPLIFLQQKSGNVVQLTASQFEHFQRTGQIFQRIPAPVENKPIIQKTITISPGDPVPTIVQKRIRKTVTESPTPVKKMKQEIAIAPAPPPPAPITPMPALTPLSSNIVTTIGPSISNTVSVTTTSAYPDLDNIEEMLPSTAIVRQPEPVVPQPEPTPAPAPSLSDGQLLAVPGEHFGGPPGSFYLCVEDSGTLTPIDNRPLVLENNQLVPMPMEPLPIMAPQPERRDILEAALANSDVFHADPPRDEAPDFRDLNANVSVHCRVSETSTTLNQPIMTPVEVPSKVDSEPTAVPSNLEDGLAVIGVTPHTVPTSLELPITVTDPRIAPKTTDPLCGTNYGTTILPSPNTEMSFVTEDVDVPMGGPISMPLLTDDDPVGKSMPILTDEVAERTVSSVESADSPSSEVRSEPEDGGHWSRRLLTPNSDTSETSSEIPLQPVIQLSVNDMSQHS